MVTLQGLILSLVPRRWAASMEADSRAWHAVCPDCGRARSVWEMGGIRWKAAGRPRWLLRCDGCGRRTWHRVEWRDPAPAAPVAVGTAE